ncbi:probable disease resistance protein At1g58602 [Panicum virgatum]|uniref:probable disease resistance protein At1g58602 n=1 Tax=Panicum virgatum TaxID=38727 RepID=UPI0019D5B805|nr:probable disease resistance protein At1g58602 [Panicum virgatum]
MASTSSAVIEEPINSVIPERMQDQISTMWTTEELQQLVGRVKEMNWLINKLSSGANENENVISVYGMRGIGKTTLVGNVYYCDDVVQNFAHGAWVRMSNRLKQDELLHNVLQHFKSDYRTYSSVRPSQELKRELAEFFEINRHKGFKCLLVIDGLSSTGEWDLVKSSLFVEDHKDVLRIIVTTRERELAYYCSRSESMWNLTRLHEDDAAKLFHLKVFDSENVEFTPDMVEQETQILDKCGGIPIFQEDLHIMRRRLVKRWIAEGYIRGMQESEAEEFGERVFNEFLSMSIIQPTKYTAITSGRVNSCSIHPLMLQVSTSKAMEEKLVCMLDNHNNAMALEGTIRHVVVRRTWRRDYEDEYKAMNLSCVRSLTVLGEWRSFFLSPDMIMLRVLDLEGVVGLTEPDLDHIGEFRHLKYLGLRSTRVKSLPKSLGKLQDLETLDIKFTYVRVLPSTIVHLARLRVLRGGLFSAFTAPETDDRIGGDTGLHIRKDIGKLRSLNTLGIVSIRVQDGLVIRELKKLTQLRRLSLVGITNENERDLCYTLQHLSSLQSLTLRSDDPDGLSRSLELSFLPQPLECLQVLKLHGRLFSLPIWISRVPYLSKLYLHSTRLRGSSDDMNVLANVPNLSTLLLLADSIVAHELTFRSAGFRLLELMEVANLGDVRYLSFKTRSMPMLKTIQITCCNYLKELSVEAGALHRLEAFQVEGCYGLRSLSLAGAGIKLPMLNKFHVGACHHLALLAFREGDMPNLETLLVSRSKNLSVEFEAGAMPRLKTLRVSRCRKLEWLPLDVSAGHNRGMSSSPVEAGAMPNLEILQIEDCHGLQRLSFTCGAMPKLLTLRVEKCGNLMELSFKQGATAKLETLQIKDCGMLTLGALSGLQHLNNLLSSSVIQ